MTQEEAEAEVRRLHAAGEPLASTYVHPRILSAAKAYYGGWPAMLKSLGIAKEPHRNRNRANAAAVRANTKWSRERVVAELTALALSGKTAKEIYDEHGDLYAAVSRVCGTTVTQLCKELGVELRSGIRRKEMPENKERKIRKFTTAEEVLQQYVHDRRNGVKRGDITYRVSIVKFFGSVDALEEAAGISATEPPITLYTRAETDIATMRMIDSAKDIDRITSEYLDSIDPVLTKSVRAHHGSLIRYFSSLDIDFCKKPYVPFTWDADNTRRQLLRWIREGEPVNYTSVAQRNTGILKAARKLYGSWDKLFEACGLNYDDYRVDTNMASYYGRVFEDIVADVLTELGAEYERTPEINGCHPDFVFADGVWADAKLSEWTVHIADCETVAKYEPHCRELNIVYLRGRSEETRKLTDKTTLMHVNTLIERLPRQTRGIFYSRTQAILDALEVSAA